ncbi:MAG: hypothetical protein ACLGI8_08340 [Acidimicrobiia bacterium]|jgi:hypothetical protein
MRKLTATALSSLLLLAACGDDGGGGGGDLSSDEQEYVDAAMAEFDPEQAEPLTEDDARCVVTSMVDSLGVDRLEELGITPASFGTDDAPFPEGLNEDEANDLVDGFDSCIDLPALFTEQMAADPSIDDETKECLEGAFDEDTIRSLFVTMLTEGEDALQEDPELLQELMSILQECPGAMG